MTTPLGAELPIPPPPQPWWNAYGPWLRHRYGGPVPRCCIDAGLGCPNRDGTLGRGGCSYCSVDSFSPAVNGPRRSITEQVLAAVEKVRRRHGPLAKLILYFQAHTNTHAPVNRLRALYDEALDASGGAALELAVGTRPDCLEPEKIDLLESYADRLDVTVELGMESIHDETLRRIRRGHSHAAFLDAVERLRGRRLSLGLHAIFGFPWETRPQELAAADVINRSGAHFLKLHHLHVVKGSALALEWSQKPFPLPSRESWGAFLCELLPRLREELVLQRLAASTTKEHLLAPAWTAEPSETRSYLEKCLFTREVRQGSLYT